MIGDPLAKRWREQNQFGMRAKGICYDTGFVYRGAVSPERLDPSVVERELAIIRDDLHCNAVRLIGGDPLRLEMAAITAGRLGLEVWFSPYPLELGADDMLALFVDCAARAEQLRLRGAEVVFVAGAELSLMNPGFLPGDTFEDRIGGLLGEGDRRQRILDVSARVNEFLATAVTRVRKVFGGRITYAAVPLERVDWSRFEIISVDLYRSAAVAGQFRDGVRNLVAQGKPVAITEFGSATYTGAGERGGQALDVVEYDKVTRAPIRLKEALVRDESGQGQAIRELLDIFDAESVDSTFVFAFALHGYPHRPHGDPRDDLDLASYSIVKMLEGRLGATYPEVPWEPKVAFSTLAEFYSNQR